MAASVQYHILRTGAPQNRVRVASRDELQLVYDGPHAEFQAPDREPMHAIRVTLTKHTEVVDHLPRLEIPSGNGVPHARRATSDPRAAEGQRLARARFGGAALGEGEGAGPDGIDRASSPPRA